MFWNRTIWRILFSLVVISFLAVGGYALYRAGFAQGVAANITLPEGSEANLMPYRMVPHPGFFYPRAGLLGFFPLLFCLGGFFLLMLMFGFGRRHYWMDRGKEYWKHHGPHAYWHAGPWGPGKPPWAADQPDTESDAPPAESGKSES